MTELMPSLCNDCVARNQCGNDDVKMCVSYIKEVKIKCDDCKFVEDCVDYGWDGCRKFTPKPKKPMTNEEWLKQANTEQLATFLAIVQYDGTDLTLKKSHVEKWVEWLKEKHE